MEDNKNPEMSVDELLEKLKASLQEDTASEKKSTDKEFDDITAAVKAAINEDGATEDKKDVKSDVEELFADTAEEDVFENEEHESEGEEAPVEEVDFSVSGEAVSSFDDDVRVAPDLDIMQELEDEEPADGENAATVEFSVASKMNVNEVLSAIGEDIDSSNLKESDGEESVDILAEVAAPDTLADEELRPSFTEEDIFAAWGIDKNDVVQNSEAAEESAPEEDSEYVAPVANSNLKIYKIARVEHKAEYSLRKQTESQKSAVDYDRTDCSLIKQALGMEKAEQGDVETSFAVFEEESKDVPKTIDAPHVEFTYQRQKEDIANEYHTNVRNSGIKLIFTAVLTVLLFAIECLPDLGIAMPEMFDFGFYPVVYVMTALQMVWICAALSYKEIANGVLSMLKFRFTPGSMLALLVLTVTVCDVLIVTMGLDIKGYNFAAVCCALIVRAYEYFDIRREVLSFEIASSDHTKKYVALSVPNEKASAIEGLEDYTGDDALVLRTEKCSFVENYFARTGKRNENDIAINKYLVPVIFAVAIVALIISISKAASATLVVNSFSVTVSVGLPILALLSASYPLFKASKRLYRRESALIGEHAVDEYAGTTMICFDDADAFPSYGVALENLRIYGKGDIETIIEQMGAVFSKLGGPLKNVFTLMTADCPRPYSVKINGVYENGIDAVVDGRELFIGNARYMEENGFAVVDKSDELRGKKFSTMYLAEDGALRAKFFIRYTLDGSFESIVKKLAKRGIASVILTGDSNINDELLARSIDISRLPVKVVRRRDFDTTAVGDRADSGVVSKGAVGDLVGAITMCDRLAGVIGTLRAVRIASAVICALLAVGSVFLQLHGQISSLHIALYHLFWLVPAWLVSKFNL